MILIYTLIIAIYSKHVLPIRRSSAHTLNYYENLGKTQYNPLLDDRASVLTVPVLIGNPGSEFDLIIDLGSLGLWVQSTLCSKCFKFPHRFNTNQSLTFKNLQKQNAGITYKNCQYHGNFSSDFLSVVTNNEVASTRINFTLALELLNCSKYNADGTIGLGMGTPFSDTPIIELFKNANEIKSALFAIYLAETPDNDGHSDPESSLEIGNTNLSYYSSDPSAIFYVPTLEYSPTWAIKIDSVQLGPWVSTGDVQVSFSSELKYFIGDVNFYFEYYAFFFTLGLTCDTNPQSFQIVCDENDKVPLPGFTFTYNSSAILLPASVIWDCSKGKCYLLFYFSASNWVFGQRFFENYYTVFNYDNSSVGIAPSVKAKWHKSSGSSLSLVLLLFFIIY